MRRQKKDSVDNILFDNIDLQCEYYQLFILSFLTNVIPNHHAFQVQVLLNNNDKKE